MDLLKISTIWQLVEKIENIRYIVKILFEAMEIEDDNQNSSNNNLNSFSNICLYKKYTCEQYYFHRTWSA